MPEEHKAMNIFLCLHTVLKKRPELFYCHETAEHHKGFFSKKTAAGVVVKPGLIVIKQMIVAIAGKIF